MNSCGLKLVVSPELQQIPRLELQQCLSVVRQECCSKLATMGGPSGSASKKTAVRSSSLPVSKFSSQPLNLVPGTILKSGRNEETHQALDDTVTTPSTMPNEHHNTSSMSDSSLRTSVSEQPVLTASESPGCAASEQAASACISEHHVFNPSALHEEPSGQSRSIQDDGECVDISAPLSSGALNVHPMVTRSKRGWRRNEQEGVGWMLKLVVHRVLPILVNIICWAIGGC
ncbi:hypothetical protein V6N12_048982 [Hibiscus sabdariffa]|uniref:Uncharacterized protein n=1 Tax=Hibiscus sabdariffa TaxID=183260 RepID=A0ABR2EIU3_9ROSI